jgi:hypothetical protein
VVLFLGVAAALLMLLTEVTNLIVVDVSGAGCEDAVADPIQAEDCEITGADQHSYALVFIALLTVFMSVGAGLGGSRPAGVALITAGVIVLLIALVGDRPDVHDTGQVGPSFEDAEANPGPAYAFELIGGALAVLAGVLRLVVRSGTSSGVGRREAQRPARSQPPDQR